MDMFWNMLYFFIYKAYCKATYYFYKYTGVFKLYNSSLVRNRFKNKFNIDNPQGYLMQWWGDIDTGGSSIIAYILLGWAFMPPALPLLVLYMRWYNTLIYKPLLLPASWIVFVVWIAIITFFGLFCILRKDKYRKYFRLFNRQSRKWKIKWAWISLAILITPLLITILTFIFTDL